MIAGPGQQLGPDEVESLLLAVNRILDLGQRLLDKLAALDAGSHPLYGPVVAEELLAGGSCVRQRVQDVISASRTCRSTGASSVLASAAVSRC